jgi:hypothetical protein
LRSAISADPSSFGTSLSTVAMAATIASRGATSSSIVHTSAGSSASPATSASPSSRISSRDARVTVREARSRVGRLDSRSFSDARRAGEISRVAISSANRSSASSIACASRFRTTAVTSAVRRGSGVRSSAAALLYIPYCASVASRFTGTRDKFTRASLNAEISLTRSSARAIAVPVERVGATSGCFSSTRSTCRGRWSNTSPSNSSCRTRR